MLGYELEDVVEMMKSIQFAAYLLRQNDQLFLYSDQARTIEGLGNANKFFQGLWAEGYLDSPKA